MQLKIKENWWKKKILRLSTLLNGSISKLKISEPTEINRQSLKMAKLENQNTRAKQIRNKEQNLISQKF